LIWASAPDVELLDAAEAGRLGTTTALLAQAERMLSDPRVDGLGAFLDGWLQPDRLLTRPTVSKQLSPELRGELLQSARRFAWQAFMHGTPEQLLLERTYPATPAIVTLMAGAPKEPAWQSWVAETEPRRGWLGHPAWLAAHAHDGYPSPVLRGVYVMDRLLCAPPSPPPPDVTRRREELNDVAALTNRQKYKRSTSGPGCHGCHSAINALGYAFEHYDELGRYRSLDAGLPVDSSGKAFGWRFEGATELSQNLATSERARRCVVEKWLTYAFGAEPSPVAFESLANLTLGAANLYGSGDVLRSQVRYFDPDRRRAGLAQDVAALVDSIGPDSVTLTLVNTNASTPRRLIVQMGAYGEHQTVSVRQGNRTILVGAPYFAVRLAAGAGEQLVVTLRRLANDPTLLFPWERRQ
jgi:hypothetical protein